MDIKAMNRQIIDEFRANGGKVGGPFKGAPMLLLTTKGAKSGETRVNPLVYLEDGSRYVIIASYAGAPTNPPWFHNLIADPAVTIEVGTQTLKVKGDVVAEPDRSRLYQKMESMMPAFTEYRQKTKRTIPVIALRRV
ncbi:MAG TPA: nitroreductase family deazaflavin-dependent oxidoreductase [Pseudomonadales bacterium]